jgi:hypothetical protein
LAFAYTVTKKMLVGDLVRTHGTYTNGSGDTGGNIDTQMDRCLWIKMTAKGTAVVATAPAANETFPCEGHAVTVVTADNEDGYWEAEGEGF